MKVLIQDQNGYRIRKLNRRTAIRANCLNCTCWTCGQVTNCPIDDCPLFEFRMGRGHQNPRTRAQAIRNYCKWCMDYQSSEISKCTAFTCPLFSFRKSRIDRSVDLDSMAKNDHIAVFAEINTSQSIPRQG